jgi:S-adenosylmethionine-diacylglycerol 3-amino-3-carboxypropyl transferase
VGRRFCANGYDGMNLSDIFEYLDEQHTQQLYGNLLALCRPKARLAYWNTLVPRSCPAVFRDRVEPLVDLASELFAADKAFFYNAFYIDQVIGPLTSASET